MPAAIAAGEALRDGAFPAVGGQGGVQRRGGVEHRGQAHRAVGVAEQLLEAGATFAPWGGAQVGAGDRERIEHDQGDGQAIGVGAMRLAGDQERADTVEAAAHPSARQRL